MLIIINSLPWAKIQKPVTETISGIGWFRSPVTRSVNEFSCQKTSPKFGFKRGYQLVTTQNLPVRGDFWRVNTMIKLCKSYLIWYKALTTNIQNIKQRKSKASTIIGISKLMFFCLRFIPVITGYPITSSNWPVNPGFFIRHHWQQVQ